MGAEINNILETSRKFISNLEQFNKVVVVLGNESCDLDSAISSLVYSVLLNHKETEDSIVIPVLNIPRIQVPVKTELNYFLNKNNINVDSIICKDEIDLKELHTNNLLQLHLVDHHVLEQDMKKLCDSVVTVIDHRPQDPAWLWRHADLTLHMVGSCCTLIAEKLFSQAPDLISPTIALLLLGVILIDTNALLPTASIATSRDISVADLLEARCIQPVDRNQLFSELQAAKRDISSLTSAQLLIKDLKVAAGIPMVGLPMKVHSFVKREDAISAIKTFCLQYNTELCVLYGMEATAVSVSRDLAVYTTTRTETASQLVAALQQSKNPDLKLQSITCTLDGLSLFEQLNVKATRKQILPIIKQFRESL